MMKKLIKYLLLVSVFLVLVSGTSSGIWTEVDESDCLKFYHTYRPGSVAEPQPAIKLDELMQRQDVIIIQATITSEEIHWNTPDGNYPLDYESDPMKYYEEKEYLMQVNEVLKGEMDESQALFITNYRSITFEVGDECIFFIQQVPNVNNYLFGGYGYMIKNDDTNAYDGPQYQEKYKKLTAMINYSNNPSFMNRLKLFFASF